MTGLTATVALQALILATGASPYKDALKTTEDTGRPLLVLVGADWCPACHAMKNSTMPRLESTGKLRGVAYTFVNTDRDSDLAGKLMRGSSIPQLVLFEKTPAGWRRAQLVGAQSEAQVQAFIRSAVENHVSRGQIHNSVAGGQ